ncbi:MAG: class 3 adenylate cyclase [Parasphingorhabdus sp.]|jgi:class 3 adenylate cyclase
MINTTESASTESLLLEREFKVLSALTIFRALSIVILFLTTLIVAFSNFERMATALICLFYLFVLTLCWRNVKRKQHLRLVGFVGVLLDVTVLALLPVIWYISVGGSEVEPAYMLKTGLAPMALLFIVLNSVAMRAVYPLLVTVGTLVIYIAYYIFVVSDPRTIVSGDYVQAIMGPHLHVGLLTGTLISIAGAGVILTFLTWSTRKLIYQSSRLENANTRLGRYFSPNLVKRLVENPELLNLGGERRVLSFVFTDLANFTALVEKKDPQELVTLLNDYLDGMIQIAFEHEGTIDKIVGDAVHVIFGAPVEQKDHAQRAVDCALAMDKFSTQFVSLKHSEGVELGITRIGVNTGSVMVGNFGGKQMFDYTAHGDAINTAARLESLNKLTGTRVAVSQNVVDQLETFVGRPMGQFILRGKTEALTVYEPLSEEHPALSYRLQYEQAYSTLDSEREVSLSHFEALWRENKQDPLVNFHRDRLASGNSTTVISSS